MPAQGTAPGLIGECLQAVAWSQWSSSVSTREAGTVTEEKLGVSTHDRIIFDLGNLRQACLGGC